MAKETSTSNSWNENERCSVLIIGLGNILLGDEGVGVRVVERIGRYDLPPSVSTLDGGTAGYALLDRLEGVEKLVIVDAVSAGGAPGSVYRLTCDDIIRKPSLNLSGHQISLSEVLSLAEKLGMLPETILIGVEPESLDHGMVLSPAVEKAMGEAAKAVLAEVGISTC